MRARMRVRVKVRVRVRVRCRVPLPAHMLLELSSSSCALFLLPHTTHCALSVPPAFLTPAHRPCLSLSHHTLLSLSTPLLTPPWLSSPPSLTLRDAPTTLITLPPSQLLSLPPSAPLLIHPPALPTLPHTTHCFPPSFASHTPNCFDLSLPPLPYSPPHRSLLAAARLDLSPFRAVLSSAIQARRAL